MAVAVTEKTEAALIKEGAGLVSLAFRRNLAMSLLALLTVIVIGALLFTGYQNAAQLERLNDRCVGVIERNTAALEKNTAATQKLSETVDDLKRQRRGE